MAVLAACPDPRLRPRPTQRHASYTPRKSDSFRLLRLPLPANPAARAQIAVVSTTYHTKLTPFAMRNTAAHARSWQ